ncbi:phosphotransferase enzyme family protein [Shewanella youngdeokensis]|uniref:Aminoglycoside phosphotransferase family protein n=1 Tax=Shewanella youngdeokensis TaxID=2999068 RepID=A0ABZ0JXL1_9GAMM|nr:aminoglycoside phosphotransferase family protein [Shewanella sp. DAU334]
MVDFIITKVLPYFDVVLENVKVTRLGQGHINQTFLVRWPAGQLVLQQINTDVFPRPAAMLNNAYKISRHLIAKSEANAYRLQVVAPERTQAGELFLDLGEQGFWRAINYLPFSHTVEVVNSVVEAEIAAKAFGHFAVSLSDLSAESIDDVIPQFHHLPGRIDQLVAAVAQSHPQRLQGCQQWVDLALGQTELLQQLKQVEAQLPLRICHNDTKINNMLFDKRDMSSLAIIDLDTCMKGYLMYDFGDMVRTFCSPEAEDSTALDQVHVREPIFAAICQGYLSELGASLSPLERQSLWLGAKVMCLMIGIRFLTDHLNGDVYFPVNHQGHNLERAANQFTLYQSLLEQQDHLSTYLK